MDIKNINSNLIGGIGALIFIITGIVSKGLTDFFSRTFSENQPLALSDVDKPMLNNTSPQLFALLITFLLIAVFGGVFTVLFSQLKLMGEFEESNLQWDEFHYRSS